jgi:hypothetical protein
VAELERLALDGQVERLLARVRELVPSYQPMYPNGGPAVVEVGRRRPAAEDPDASVVVATRRKVV